MASNSIIFEESFSTPDTGYEPDDWVERQHKESGTVTQTGNDRMRVACDTYDYHGIRSERTFEPPVSLSFTVTEWDPGYGSAVYVGWVNPDSYLDDGRSAGPGPNAHDSVHVEFRKAGHGIRLTTQRDSPTRDEGDSTENRFGAQQSRSELAWERRDRHEFTLEWTEETATLSMDGNQLFESNNYLPSGQFPLYVLGHEWTGRGVTELVVSNLEIRRADGESSREDGAGLSIHFEDDLSHPQSIENYENWDRQGGPCCDDPSGRFYTWEEADAGSNRDRPPSEKEPITEADDLTGDYYDSIGGNFIIQQSGGFGNFWSVYSFSEHATVYPDAPFTPTRLTIRVGGNDRAQGFNDFGAVQLKDSEANDVVEFRFPMQDSSGGFAINGGTVVGNRNNGLYEVVLSNIDWEAKSFDVDVYQQTEKGYREDPVHSETRVAFHEANARNFDAVRTHCDRSGHVYFDALELGEESGPEGATTQTTMTTVATTPESRTTTATPGLTSARPTDQYDLRAGTTRVVRPDGTRLYVIRDIPGARPDRAAVTNPDYELVGRSPTIDALAAEYYEAGSSAIDYEEELTRAREHRERAKDLELSGRIVDAGVDLTVILNSFLAGQPQLAIGSAISLTTDVINWGYTEYADPFEEGFTKMAATLNNAKSIQEKSREMRNDSTVGRQVSDLMNSFTLGADAAQAGAGLAGAWDEALSALKRSRFPTKSAGSSLQSADDLAAQSVDDAVVASSGLFAGFAIGAAVGEIDSVVTAKTKIHTAELAYETQRIPLLERLLRLSNRIDDGTVTYPLSIEYGLLQAIESQMGAIMFQIGSDYWTAISASPTGTVWDVISNAEKKANNYATTAQALEEASKWMYIGAGASDRDIRERTDASINAEILNWGMEDES